MPRRYSLHQPGKRGERLRLLVFGLSLLFLITAVLTSWYYGRQDILQTQARLLEKSLQQKETKVNDALHDAAFTDSFKQGSVTPARWNVFKKTFKDDGINLFVYRNGRQVFWSTDGIDGQALTGFKNSTTIYTAPNGKYLVMGREVKGLSFIFSILLQHDYAIQNEYLQNRISPYLNAGDKLEIAGLRDEFYAPIHLKSGEYAFDVKLKPNIRETSVTLWHQWLTGLALLFFTLSLTGFSVKLAEFGRPFTAALLMAAVLFLLRVTDLEWNWYSRFFGNELFDARKYSESFWLPSLGALALNVLAVVWLLAFLNITRKYIHVPAAIKGNYRVGILVATLYTALGFYLGWAANNIMRGLLLNSTINFNVTLVNNLSWLSWFCLLVLCLLWCAIFLAIIYCNYQCWLLKVKEVDRWKILLVMLAVITVYELYAGFSIDYLLYALYLIFASYVGATHRNKVLISYLTIIYVCMASLTAMKFLAYTAAKEQRQRRALIEKLAEHDNPATAFAVTELEERLANDKGLQMHFADGTAAEDTLAARQALRKYTTTAFNGFDKRAYVQTDAEDTAGGTGKVFEHYLDAVQQTGVRLPESKYFYKINRNFGYEDYIGIIPFTRDNALLGRLLVVLQARRFTGAGSYPRLLIDNRAGLSAEYNNYSVAFYENGRLVTQRGPIYYPLTDNVLGRTGGRFYNVTDTAQQVGHLVYKPVAGGTIVMSKPVVSFLGKVASFSFFFISFTIFSLLASLVVWLQRTFGNRYVTWFTLNRVLIINANKILYKTRIQVTVVVAVVVTLVVVGWTTFYYLNSGYREQQRAQLQNAIDQVQLAIEQNMSAIGADTLAALPQNAVNAVARANNVPVHVFDARGRLIYTTLPELFDNGIIARKMNAAAFVNLTGNRSSKYLTEEEQIGDLCYSAAYAPVRDKRGNTLFYATVPYYNYRADYASRINTFLNTLVNIYAFVFVLIVVLAIFLANQITEPLKFIQQRIRRSTLDGRNAYIDYPRHDEIGQLVKEYNNLIAQLDESARKLARSERESAWRDMAKQVAHEIKNPLTPLKLGVQLLERSWRDNDPAFSGKFDRFIASFIEQIESLSRIAGEFSYFAKMPDTRLGAVDVFAIVRNVAETFEPEGSSLADIRIDNRTGELKVGVMGDRDQLVRIFNNLIKNAIEAVPEGTLPVIHINLDRGGSFVFIEVADNGTGIAEEVRERIFTPSFTSKTSGNGLGLPFVKQAVENAGGQIEFKTEAGRGTSFFIKLVAAQLEDEA